jgi:hypothetical protein
LLDELQCIVELRLLAPFRKIARDGEHIRLEILFFAQGTKVSLQPFEKRVEPVIRRW